jgi:tRNA U34 5-methylaminomethyl-2-thiouridine-forming methyltransferase MnmC
LEFDLYLRPFEGLRVMDEPPYRLVRLANGVSSVHSLAHRETFHPVVGPELEAETLYVRQLRIRERFAAARGPFVIWDVGLGAAANLVTVLRALQGLPGRVEAVSFDLTLEPLRFALAHAKTLEFFGGWEKILGGALPKMGPSGGTVEFDRQVPSARWDVRLGDFPEKLFQWRDLPAPDVILFDAFSPARNPAMWTQPLFTEMFRRLDPNKGCALATYSRSTLLRVSLLLAGFWVGSGSATGEKEETTIAANSMELIERPLDARWLRRARLSTSAEPLWEPVYRQAPLSDQTWERLCGHPQFREAAGD